MGGSDTGFVGRAGFVGFGGRGLGVTVELTVEELLVLLGRITVGAEGGRLTVVGVVVEDNVSWDWKDSLSEER